jgi:hypothetical protein
VAFETGVTVRQKSTQRRKLLAVGVCLLALAAASQARVFVRWGGAAPIVRTLQAMGAVAAYEADMMINGGRGHCTVLDMERPIGEVVDEIRRALPQADVRYGGRSLATASLRTASQGLRLIVAEIDRPAQTIVFHIEQSAAEFDAASRLPGPDVLKDVPSLPGSRLEFFSRDEETGLSLAVSTCPAPAARARRDLGEKLKMEGWAPIVGASSDTDVYIKPQFLCCVRVDPTVSVSGARITVLHKPLGVK